MQITVIVSDPSFVKDKSFFLEVAPSETIGDLKAQIQEQTDIPSNNLKITYNKKVFVDDGLSLSDCGIGAGGIVNGSLNESTDSVATPIMGTPTIKPINVAAPVTTYKGL